MKKFLLGVMAVSVAIPAWAFDIEKYSGSVPEAQKKLVEVVDKARADYKSAANDMAQGGTRPARAKAVCGLLKGGMAVKDWVGEITTLSTNGDGHGVLAVDIGGKVTLSTWNNALSDLSDKTLINPNTPVFAKVSALKKRTLVKISGRFVAERTDCIREQSMTLGGSIKSPVYTFRFSDVTPIP